MSKKLDGEARDRLVIWLRRQMTEFGITPEALAASIEADTARAAIYHDAHGNEWDGIGDMPEWLSAAKNAGVDPDFFRINREGEKSGPASDLRQTAFFFSQEA
jgi:DNA-binding protein H-NS